MTITDPRDKTILNCYIVTINNDEEVCLGSQNNVLENGNCNENAIVNSEILIVGADGNKINKTWYKNPITLNVKFTDSEKDPNNYSYCYIFFFFFLYYGGIPKRRENICRLRCNLK